MCCIEVWSTKTKDGRRSLCPETHANVLVGRKTPSARSMYFAALSVLSRLPVVVTGLFIVTRLLCNWAYMKAVWA